MIQPLPNRLEECPVLAVGWNSVGKDRFLLMSIVACSDRSSIAASYKNPWDRVVVQLGFGFGYEPCYRKEETTYGDVLEFIGNEACFRFDPPERMRGVWLDEFEGSEFLPNATEAPANRPTGAGHSRNAIWLDFTRHEPLLADRHDARRAFAIEFVGRRATFPGRYGHMGGSPDLVIVKELLSATLIPPPRSPADESAQSTSN